MKLTSRKFWVSVCVILCGAGTLITGCFGDNQWLSIVGALLVAVGGVVYNFVEGKIDSNNVFNKSVDKLNEMLDSIDKEENNNG